MPDNAAAGALNLLKNCADLQPRDRLLIVHEGRDTGYYDDEIVEVVADCAKANGARVTLFEEPFHPEARDLSPMLFEQFNTHDKIIFLARIGDQLRFRDLPPGKLAIVCYALDVKMLGSEFGTTPYGAMEAIKNAVNKMLNRAASITVTCAGGSEFTGANTAPLPPEADVSINRFPMSVFTPIPAQSFSGRLALPGFLVGTGSMYYAPYAVDGLGPAHVIFRDGRITGFEGDETAVNRIREHYDFVAGQFEIDRDFMHSWHAGIHPGCAFADPIAASYERWSGSAFGNPRLLHFHTCGDYAPGEISINLIDPTILVDGVPVWQNGVLALENIPQGEDILRRYPEIAQTFANPSREIGL